ncbi:hypothetical protein EJ078_10950 [Mesorhizobium sp. M1A.F.Ca.IN.022.06.1.1]|uniref:hypothetical protein n=1 Tax=Mesorhizobium sp. M1A.F.Ca.IN.022.06.1.1 TaxID=2493680 RepID=UPI000F763FCC|nr:hypothetical protein [Mesorhizobium sp. M1A.F.Ca.IN.022.06.1.1]AZO59695.1 hypothetical protein EJ078_10950 [Mesorhizobium sp. M1A.F.Ca.IN.022.06.1.1]
MTVWFCKQGKRRQRSFWIWLACASVFQIVEVTLDPSLSTADATEITNVLSYGPEAGMNVTITGRSGIDTDHAQINLKLTPQDAKGYCAESQLNSGLLQCIDRTLKDVNLQAQVSANCETGEFTNVWGRRFIFKGAAADGDYAYNLEAEGGDTSEERSSNYDVAIDNFKAMCPTRIAQADAISPADSDEAPAVAKQPTCDELLEGGSYFHGKAFADLSVAEIDALLEIASGCKPEMSTVIAKDDVLAVANYDAMLQVLVSNLKEARTQALMVAQEQAKTQAGKQALIKLTERARALPLDPSSEAALRDMRAEMIRIRNESVGVWESKEWNELDNLTEEKLQAIETGQMQQPSPNANAGTAGSIQPGPSSSSPPSLQNFADQSSLDPRISEMTCSVRGTAVLGVPNMGSEDPENEVEVGLTSAGDFIVEGKRIAAVDVVRNGGSVTFSMISAEDYLLAGSKDATGASMGLSDDENMQFQAMQKMFLGGALHGRKRFAIYDVANSRLSFADADGQQFKNITEANCIAH